jgi:hypothetical protein
MSVHNSEQTEWGKEANALDQNSYSEQDRTDKSKLESFVRYVCVRIEVESGLGSGRRQVRVVLAVSAEVLLDDVVRDLINVDIVMILQNFDLVQSVALLDHRAQLLHLRPRHLQHVVDPVQHDLNHLGVLAVEQVAEGGDDAFADQGRHLLLVAADGQVADGPGGLLLRLEVALAQVVDDLGQEIRVDHRLHLHLVAGGYVGQEPDGLLADFFLRVGQEGGEVGQRVAVQDDLGLFVGSGDDVAHGAERRRLYFHFFVAEQGDQLGDDAAVYHHLDLLVAAVG